MMDLDEDVEPEPPVEVDPTGRYCRVSRTRKPVSTSTVQHLLW